MNRIFPFCLFITISILSGCVKEPQILRINHFNQITDFSTNFAEEKGYFQDTQITLEKLFTQKGSDAITALLADEIDLAMVSSYVLVNALMNPEIERRDDLRLICIYLSTYHGMSVIADGTENINSPEDFRGKTIGVNRGTQFEYYLDTLLAYYELDSQEIKIRNETEQEHLANLRDGVSDIVITSDPFRSRILNSPEIEVRLIEMDKFLRLNMILITTEQALASKRTVINSYLKAIDRVASDFKEMSNETVDLLTRIEGIDHNRAMTFLKDSDFSLKLDSHLVLTMIKQAEWNHRRSDRFIREIPDFKNILLEEVVRAIDPDYIDL